ncbi:MAG: hypothetical protein A3A65_00160 [Candidatus Chisholmbacteria bacterium RIFCSPLOWO2_01_FULL_49_14]|uniref:Uncharacterized protein n=1 Tax=Candidatus Chisholmbacteria bacterium RIFCSPLOWO2_01_FULL_49_14 TaxID=1797593 RepID=A0A1G1W1A1_9BACT|nr:MAG: hypothetical protein A3A65_00160 [Candidatus Chisholmbacteria bacterium RIFCSPLOWO2_01_FULL_49_14]
MIYLFPHLRLYPPIQETFWRRAGAKKLAKQVLLVVPQFPLYQYIFASNYPFFSSNGSRYTQLFYLSACNTWYVFLP